MTTYLTKEDILDIHEKVRRKFNDPEGVLNKGNLDTVIEIPQRTVFGRDLHYNIPKGGCTFSQYDKTTCFCRN